MFLVNTESVLLLAIVKYMLCSHFTQNCIFWCFLEAKNPRFVMKMLKIFLYLCICFVQKLAQLISHKNHHNSGMTGRRKLLDPSLNRIFNALSIGVQYMLSFQLTDFGLKYLLQSHLFSAFSSFQTSNVSFAFHVLSPFLGSSPSEVFVSSNFYFRIIPFKFSFAPRFSFIFM